MEIKAKVRDQEFQANNISAVVQRSQDDVEVRYNDGTETKMVQNTTTTEVLSAVTRAHTENR